MSGLSQRVYAGRKLKVLLVDDNHTSLRLLEHILHNTEYETMSFDSGVTALDYLKTNPLDINILLLDRIMPGVDGIEVCQIMKSDDRLRHIPIVMETAASDPEEISEGIEAGVFYYLTKPINPETLRSVLASAAKEVMRHQQLRSEMMHRQTSYGLISSMTCTFKTLEEADHLTTFLANLFPDPDRLLVGISELLINAVEHGNLGISYEMKSKYNAENRLTREIKKLHDDPLYGARIVTAIFNKKSDCYTLEISDEGDGFDWRKYLEVEPSRVLHNHGRGIAMAKMLSFDSVEYNEKGNRVICTLFDSSDDGHPRP